MQKILAVVILGFLNIILAVDPAHAGQRRIAQTFNWFFLGDLIENPDGNIDVWSKKGMALNVIESYNYDRAPGQPIFAGEFQPTTEPWYYSLNVSGQEFSQQFTQRLQSDFRIKDLSVRVYNNIAYFSGIWTPAKGQEHGFYYGLTDAGFSDIWKRHIEKEGY